MSDRTTEGRTVQRYKVVQDKGEYCLKGCPDGDLVDYSEYAALLRRFPAEPRGKEPPHCPSCNCGEHILGPPETKVEKPHVQD